MEEESPLLHLACALLCGSRGWAVDIRNTGRGSEGSGLSMTLWDSVTEIGDQKANWDAGMETISDL